MSTLLHNLQASADPERIAERLRIVRQVEGLSQAEFAQRADIAPNAWNNYEKARKRISLDAAIRLCAEYGLTLDYIYFGDSGNLTYNLVNAIKAVEDRRRRGARDS